MMMPQGHRVRPYLVMVLVLACLIPPPTASRAHQMEAEMSFAQVWMFSPLEGWGQGDLDNDGEILTTHDGGVTWRLVYAPFQIIPYQLASFFLDADHAWLMESTATPAVWYTDAAGQLWLRATLPGGSLLGWSGLMRFVDSQTGWLLALDCCAAGNEFAKLFQTTDGGQHWHLINDTDRQDGLDTTYHTGMEFFDAKTGWMTEASIAGYGGLLKTTDGGVTWVGVELPVPATEATLQGCDMQQPLVVGADAMLFVTRCIMRSKPTMYLYVTEDGGQTWTIQTFTTEAGESVFPERVEMMNQQVGWFVLTHADSTQSLYQTTDGGQTWHMLGALPDRLGDQYDGLDFLNPHEGWLVTSSGALFHTVDGGSTWTPLDAHVLLSAS